MKLLCTEYNSEGDHVIVTLGDDALLRNNDDFYFPDFTTALSCIPQPVVRLSKLGKGIGQRFAGRYYEEVGLGIRFYADSYEEELMRHGLPRTPASSFAECAAISPLVYRQDYGEGIFVFSVNGKEMYRGYFRLEEERICSLISEASAFHTLKIGDFLFCGNIFRHRGLQTGDRLTFSLDGRDLTDFRIK